VQHTIRHPQFPLQVHCQFPVILTQLALRHPFRVTALGASVIYCWQLARNSLM
jgi:hypothetical protein